MAKLERLYTVPLNEAYEAVRNKRVPRAVKILRAFITRHMKADGERIVLSEALNKYLWTRSIQRPPRKIKVRLVKDSGMINAYLHDEKVEEKKAAKEEKKDEPKKESKPAETKENAGAAPKSEAHSAAKEHKKEEKK